nr:transposase [Streptomyces sp. 846.5]
MARSSSKTVTEVARDLGASPKGLRSWVKQAQSLAVETARVEGKPSRSADPSDGPTGSTGPPWPTMRDRFSPSAMPRLDSLAGGAH